jgi:hypothetical protein
MTPATSPANAPAAARFIAEVPHVKEVTLHAAAKLDFWRERLSAERLYPWEQAGAAEIIISATDLHWMGKRTYEVTLGLTVSARADAATRDGLYLLQAFNSSRLFAWMERTFFNTPYSLGRIQFSAQPPAAVTLSDAQGVMAELSMKPAAAPTLEQEEMWQGVIYLPGGRYFVARLGGHTQVYPFDPAAHTARFEARDRYPAFQWLLDCGLRPLEWHIRQDAIHARSRTFTRVRG